MTHLSPMKKCGIHFNMKKEKEISFRSRRVEFDNPIYTFHRIAVQQTIIIGRSKRLLLQQFWKT